MALPRRLVRPCLACSPSNLQPLTHVFASLTLTSTQSQRHASILSSLSDTQGAYNKKIRRGRGPSSGKGKTSGRGHGGQKQHGKVPAGFNGGQTPDHVVAGERGFYNHHSVDMSPINLDKIQLWIDQGRLDPSKPITLKELTESRCLHGIKDGVKLLSKGSDTLRTPIEIVVSRASSAAIAAVEAAGGKVLTRYYSPFAIKKIQLGLMDPIYSLNSQPPTEAAAAGAEETASAPAPAQAATLAPIAEEAETQDSDDAFSSPESPSDGHGPLLSLQPVPLPPLFATRPRFPFRLPDPTARKDIEYYRDPAHRGYMAWQVGAGEGPSLFFKIPGAAAAAARAGKGERKVKGGERRAGKKRAGENRLW